MPSVESQLCDTYGCKKAPLRTGLYQASANELSAGFGNVGGLRSFLSLNDLELHFIPLGERLEAAALYRAEMDEDIGSTLSRNEAKAFGVVKPFYRSSYFCH